MTGISLAAGAEITMSRTVGLLMLACIPPAVLVMVFRGAPDQSIGQILYETEHASEIAVVGGPVVPAEVSARKL
jgi:hypothetical protein